MDNGHEPATKADLKALKDELTEALRGTEAKLTEQFTEVLRDTETKLLKAFYSFAESNHKRVNDNERDAAGLKERLGTIEGRVTEIEKRLNMPPAS